MLELFKRKKKGKQKIKCLFLFLIPQKPHQQQGFTLVSGSFALDPYTCTFYLAKIIDASKNFFYYSKDVLLKSGVTTSKFKRDL